MPSVGPLELAIVLVIVLLLFGAKRLPQLGRTLGREMHEFKESLTFKSKEDGPTRELPPVEHKREGDRA